MAQTLLDAHRQIRPIIQWFSDNQDPARNEDRQWLYEFDVAHGGFLLDLVSELYNLMQELDKRENVYLLRSAFPWPGPELNALALTALTGSNSPARRKSVRAPGRQKIGRRQP